MRKLYLQDYPLTTQPRFREPVCVHIVPFLMLVHALYFFTVGILIQLASLAISAVTLAFLVKYVRSTEIIARQSVQQVESTFRPAIVAQAGRAVDDAPSLINIGKGPAIEVEWSVSTRPDMYGTIPCLELDRRDPYPLHQLAGMKPFFQATPALPVPAIICNYKSISGMTYSSASTYGIDRGQFSTTFSDPA